MKGKYARIFEEEYRRAAKLPEFISLFKEVDLRPRPRRCTTVIFRSTKPGAGPTRQTTIKSARDNAERAYNLIMKDKEKLLGFETKLKFIFRFGAEGRLGQSERVSDLRVARDRY